MKPTTVSVATPIARTLTDNGVCLHPYNEHTPLYGATEQLRIAVDPDNRPLSATAVQQLMTRFDTENENVGVEQDEELATIAHNMATGIAHTVAHARDVLIPYCKDVKARFDAVRERQLPVINVSPYVYHPIHNHDVLVNHIAASYCTARIRDTYRTFIVDKPNTDTLVAWLLANKHVEEDQTQTWIQNRVLADELLDRVWIALFTDVREILPGEIDFTRRGNLTLCVDQLLTAYLLTGYLCHEPQDVVGESASAETWESAIGKLHTYFGALLCQAYTDREKNIRHERLVMQYDVTDTGPGGQSVNVITNGDVHADWAAEGKDIRVLLGAAVVSPTRMYIADFHGHEDELIRQWERKHYFLKSKALDEYLKHRRQTLRGIIFSCEQDTDCPTLATCSYSELSQRLDRELACITEEALDDVNRTIVALVCDVFYPGSTYKAFLQTMDRIAKDYPNVTSAREVATLAAIEMTGIWLARQLVKMPVVSTVDEVTDDADVPA